MNLSFLKAQLLLLSISSSITTLKAEQANSRQDEKEKLLPPELASKSAQLGIKLYEEYGGRENFRIPQILAQENPLSVKEIYEILEFFENTEIDTRESGWENRSDPSVEWVRWLMMGGESAWEWARIVKRMRTATIEIPE